MKGMDLVGRLNFGIGDRLPMIKQTEVAECALACLAMIACYHGHDIDLPSLRNRFPSSAKGASLKQLSAFATQLSLNPRAISAPLEALRHVHTPAILHWDLSHFVVLKKVYRNSIVIHDPARGIVTMRIDEASKHYTGVAMELTSGSGFTPIVARQKVTIREVAGGVRGVGKAFAFIIVIALAIELLNLVTPFYTQWILDQVIVVADTDLLTVLAATFLAVAVVQAGLTAARQWTITWIGASANVQWSTNVISHLLRLPLSWFERRHIGDINSRLGSIKNIQNTLTGSFLGSLLDGFMSVIMLIVMGLYSMKLTVFVVAMVLTYATLRMVFLKPLWRAQDNLIVQSAKQQSEVLESIRGILSIKAANMQSARMARITNAIVSMTNRDIISQRLTIAFAGASQLISSGGRVILLWMAAREVLANQFTPGMFVAFVAYSDQLFGRSSGLIDKLIDLRMLGLQAERLSDITMTALESDTAMPYDGDLKEYRIAVRELSFRYDDSSPWVFRGLNFDIAPGESLAIIGPSGCGKSTLAKVLCGLLEPVEGQVLLGGVSIKQLGLSRYREMLGVVMQGDMLFGGSISDNIAFGGEGVNPEKLVAVSKAAAMHGEISRMPMGYQTPVGDMGAMLSGGQKQRLFIARALYRDPKILVLDEATSHLDLASEAVVSNYIKRMQITRFIIAHRPETIRSADRVIDMGTLKTTEGEATLVE